jgi:hypothetical protein
MLVAKSFFPKDFGKNRKWNLESGRRVRVEARGDVEMGPAFGKKGV